MKFEPYVGRKLGSGSSGYCNPDTSRQNDRFRWESYVGPPLARIPTRSIIQPQPQLRRQQQPLAPPPSAAGAETETKPSGPPNLAQILEPEQRAERALSQEQAYPAAETYMATEFPGHVPPRPRFSRLRSQSLTIWDLLWDGGRHVVFLYLGRDLSDTTLPLPTMVDGERTLFTRSEEREGESANDLEDRGWGAGVRVHEQFEEEVRQAHAATYREVFGPGYADREGGGGH